jgi:hypothetical protein
MSVDVSHEDWIAEPDRGLHRRPSPTRCYFCPGGFSSKVPSFGEVPAFLFR